MVAGSILDMVDRVRDYVPSYRLKADPVFERGLFGCPGGPSGAGYCLARVPSAEDYFPPYAGNLYIMTATATRVGEAIARSLNERRVAT